MTSGDATGKLRRVMRRSRRFPVLARFPVFAVSLACWARSAEAQAPAAPTEPHGFVEPCTVANLQEMDVDCELCPVPAADAEACSKRLGTSGYQKKCRTRGDAAGWGEVWCIRRAAAPAASARPEPAPVPMQPPPSEAPPNQLPKLLLGLGLGALLAVYLILRARARQRLKK